jgi:hypothetical protein
MCVLYLNAEMALKIFLTSLVTVACEHIGKFEIIKAIYSHYKTGTCIQLGSHV